MMVEAWGVSPLNSDGSYGKPVGFVLDKSKAEIWADKMKLRSQIAPGKYQHYVAVCMDVPKGEIVEDMPRIKRLD